VVGVSAGASTPNDLVSEVVERLCRDGADLQEHVIVEERVAFRLPPGLAATTA
jgi:4-hydroxy-3-methylbut-2-enyl diphosphate reductase IspH